jgi:hypothetical protein
MRLVETLSRRRFIQTAAGAPALGLATTGVGAKRDAGYRGPVATENSIAPSQAGLRSCRA